VGPFSLQIYYSATQKIEFGTCRHIFLWLLLNIEMGIELDPKMEVVYIGLIHGRYNEYIYIHILYLYIQ
jgi:hypothetical protein